MWHKALALERSFKNVTLSRQRLGAAMIMKKRAIGKEKRYFRHHNYLEIGPQNLTLATPMSPLQEITPVYAP